MSSFWHSNNNFPDGQLWSKHVRFRPIKTKIWHLLSTSTEILSLKIPGVSHLVPIWPILGSNLTNWTCSSQVFQIVARFPMWQFGPNGGFVWHPWFWSMDFHRFNLSQSNNTCKWWMHAKESFFFLFLNVYITS